MEEGQESRCYTEVLKLVLRGNFEREIGVFCEFQSLLGMEPIRQEEMLRGHPKKAEKLWAQDWL